MLNLKNIKNFTISQQNAQFKKYKFLYSRQKSPKKLISRCNMQPNTLTRQEYKGKIKVKFVLEILEKFTLDPRKIIPDSQRCRQRLQPVSKIRAFSLH
jgi:hypothetical protein